ncbi:MAG: HAD family hydrolase [Acidobacteriaceae bacterium]
MPLEPVTTRPAATFVRPGFDWQAADAFLFDIDGTLLNTRDGVHYRTFTRAFRDVWGTDETIDGVPWHGNTDVGIIRGVAARAQISEEFLRLHEICSVMTAEIARTRDAMRPEVCAGVRGTLDWLKGKGKLLGVATGNIEAVGWAKLENCGIRDHFSLGAFSGPGCETREDVFREGVDQIRAMLSPSAVIHVVGDTPQDISAARHVGIPVIAVATGKYNFSELLACGPDMLLASLAELALCADA